MRFDYNRILRDKLYALQTELGLSDFNFEVDSEQAFLKAKDLQPNTIYVLTKDLQNDNSIGVETQPLQILILSEQDSLDIAKVLFTEFAKKYNFEAISETYVEDDETKNIWIKQQYSDPVVLSNFNTVDYGYRSVLYVSATLYIMYGVIDVKNVTVDDNPYEVLNFNVSYSMSTNTQQLPGGAGTYIASSLKTVSTFALTMTVPMLENALVKKVLNIMAETDDTNNNNISESDRIAYDGNNSFVISFDCAVGNQQNDYKITISKTMRLISAQLITAPNQVPSLQLGFMK